MKNIANLQFIQSATKGGKFIINGDTGTGKTEFLLSRYRHMIEELGIPGDSILVLLSNSVKLRQWKDAANFSISSSLKCYTFNGFVQNELQIYYPFVSGACTEIEHKEIKPVFLGYEPSKYLISKAVQLRRERNGAFSGLVSTPEKAASELLGSLLAASACGIPYNEIGTRLGNALERKDSAKVDLLGEVDEIIDSYCRKCLELGIFDASMCTMLYSRYLLSNIKYLEMLGKRIKHIIVDDLQECTPTAVELFRILCKSADSCAFSFNEALAAGSRKEHAANFLNELREDCFETIQLQKCHTCNEKLYSFSEQLSALLSYGNSIEIPVIESQTEASKAVKKDTNVYQDIIERHPPSELRSDMLQQLGERVISLIEDDCCSPSDIVILSTYADSVTELVLANMLKRKGYKLLNISRRSKISDIPLCRSILTFTQLCHPALKLFPSRDDLKLMCSRLFMLDPVRCTIIARRIYNTVPFPRLPDDSWPELENTLGTDNYEKYIYIKRWVDTYIQQDKTVSIGEFLYKVLTEVFLSEDTDLDEVLEAREMTDMAMQFSRIVSNFGRITTRDFIELARNQAIMPESKEEQEERLNGEHVFLATPASFLTNALKCKVLVLCGLSSNNWMPGAATELSNPYVLSNAWKQGMLYNDQLDIENKKLQLVQWLVPVLKCCSKKLVTFESSLSAGGFQNDGILPELFDTIISND